jgi:hypothetical protein
MLSVFAKHLAQTFEAKCIADYRSERVNFQWWHGGLARAIAA